MLKPQRLKIEIPSEGDDKPRAARVGLVVVGGVLVGIFWPLLAGIKLVPEPPSGDGRTLAAPSAEPAQSQSASLATASAVPPPAAPATPAEVGDMTTQRLRVSKSTVTSCRDAKDKKVSECDELAFDRIAMPRFVALEQCPAAANATGMLSLGFDIDFRENKLVRIASGKSTTLPAETAQALVACVTRDFEAASLEGIKHEHTHYTLFYRIEFPAPGQPASASSENAPADMTAASGNATVGWVAAIIRDAPTKDAREVGRVLSGTRVTVVAHKGDWYKVKYDAKGSEGWVYRAAIGL